ncbi:MAG TPA: hypothetical protein VLB00_07590 [Gemmatimonadales bacterium]|nr:hypothetical protein [Gemmatimonadales bacterium]
MTPVTAGLPPHEEGTARKQRKREAKLHRDATRPPRSLERWRILMDVVDEGRRVADLADHKARYALVVMGALNAGVFLILSRAHLLSDLPPVLKPWLIGALVAYAGLSCLFVYHAIDCIRPRWLRDAVGPGGAGSPEPLGLLYWESIGRYEEKAYRKAWNTVRMDQHNGEVVVISHHLALLIRHKYRALDRLFRGLALLVILAALQLLVYGAIALAG